MHLSTPKPSSVLIALVVSIALAALGVPAGALGAASPKPSRPPLTPVGTLAQLHGGGGCVIDRSQPASGCTRVRALQGPAPVIGSDALAISPDGKNVYVASSKSNAIAVFMRSARTGKLTQAAASAGCIALAGGNGCATARGLAGPNSVTVSPDGKNVYATSLVSSAIASFRRNRSTGALTQAGGASGCITNAATTGCTTGRALGGADVVSVTADGRNVYVGAFNGGAVAVFTRDTSSGALTQPSGTAGCIANSGSDGCAAGFALGEPEGLAISGDGNNVYVGAALGNALDVLVRNPSTGALTQANDGSGCISSSVIAGCTPGAQLAGADAVAVSPDDGDVYATSLLSNSVTSFTRTANSGQLLQQGGTSACVVYLLAVGCSLGRALDGPEGLAVSPDGANVYTAAFGSGAIAALNRNPESGALSQKPRAAGCVASSATPDCTLGRALSGVSSLAVSPDGSYLYSAAFKSDTIGVFKRITK